MDFRDLRNLNFRLTVDDLKGLPSVTLHRLRRECQTNLRFLTNCILRPMSPRAMSLSESVHGRIIDGLLKPDPVAIYDEWSEYKEFVVKASRGMLKSTIIGGLLVQLQLCDPDIRISVISGKQPLAKSILGLGRVPFAANETLRGLFPDWAVDEDDLGGEEFTCPKRNSELNLRDPTLSIATFDSVKAGGHYEVVIFDDCTNEVNMRTPDLVEKALQNFDDTDPLVEPGGYRLFSGTVWADDTVDLPEVIKRRGEAFEEEHGYKNTSYVCIPAWTLKVTGDAIQDAAILHRERQFNLNPSDVVLTWPEKLTSKFLFPLYRKNPQKFTGQYLMKWAGGAGQERFPHDLLLKHTVPYSSGLPLAHDRLTIVNWDLAGIWSGKQSRQLSDFSFAFAVMFEVSTKRMFIYDAAAEVFASSTEAANRIVHFFQQQTKIGPVYSCDIEDALGARMLEGEILRVAKALNIPLTLRFQPKQLVKDAKAIRISTLVGAMQNGLVQFSTGIPHKELIYTQFEKWAPDHKNVRDDAPDCAAQIWYNYRDKIFPSLVSSLMPSENTVWAPEPFQTQDEPDTHAEERVYADLEWLQSMTAPHAGGM